MTDNNSKAEDYLNSVQKNVEYSLFHLKLIANIDFIKQSGVPSEDDLQELKDMATLFFGHLFAIARITGDLLKNDYTQDVLRLFVLSGLMSKELSEESDDIFPVLFDILDDYMLACQDAYDGIIDSSVQTFTPEHSGEIKKACLKIVSEIEKLLETFRQDLSKTKP